jgi:sensor histidine kinase YesM
LLSVRDDGAGLNGGRDGTSHGVGLRNTRARLQQLYGHAQALRVSDVAENGGGACVEIELPFRSFIPADGAGLA